MQQRFPLQLHISPKPKVAFTYTRAGILDTGWHQHGEHQLLYAEGGVLYVWTEERQFLLPAHHGAWIPAQCVHKLCSTSTDTRLWLLYFQTQQEEDLVLQHVRIFAISTLARTMILYTERWPMEGQADATERSFYETIRLLAVEWCRQPLPLVLPTTDDLLLGKILEYIQENLADSLQLGAIADRYGMSSRTLMRLFRSQLNMTFGAYLRVARIVQAVALLTSASISVTEVAHQVGYNSSSSFSHAFRHLMGMTPQAYATKSQVQINDKANS